MQEHSGVKPGLCPDSQSVDSQQISSHCEDDTSCQGAKKCCKANTGAMICLKAESSNSCNIRGTVLQRGESVIVNCFNCTCFNDTTLMCPSYNCSGVLQTTGVIHLGSCPDKPVDPGECFAHLPCSVDADCNKDQKCCDVSCGVPICIATFQSPGVGCRNGDDYYSPGLRSNVSNSEVDCEQCLCESDGQWHCQLEQCTAKSKKNGAGVEKRAFFLLEALLFLFMVTTL
ncbi:uncharacterized protein [Dysidea avara]|uniref:uncharacterized protein isoform X2 n=1 Tax=Dysidea avara TaxID=196820 RepID=UPI0033209A97